MAAIDASGVATATSTWVNAVHTQAGNAISAISNLASNWSLVTMGGSDAFTVTSSSGIAKLASNVTLAADKATLLPHTALDAITLDTLPTPPDFSSYTTGKWNETAWTNLKTLVSNITSSITGSDDIDSTITKLASTETLKLQVAMYAAEKTRRQKTLQDAFSAADSSTGKRGFTYPNSMTVALKLKAQQEFQFEMRDTANTIIKMIFDWAKNNFQFAIQQQMSAHQLDVDFNVRYMSAVVDDYRTKVNVLLEKYKQTVTIEIEKLGNNIKEYQLLVEKYKAEDALISEFDRTRIQAYSQEINQRISAARVALENNANNASKQLAAATAAANAVMGLAQASAQMVIATGS